MKPPTPWPAWARRALALGGAGLAAKGLALGARISDGGTGVEGGGWAALALVHQDALAMLAWAGADGLGGWLCRGHTRLRLWQGRGAWIAVMALVVWAAVNVPLARLFGTPATWPFLGAAGGALSDSILAYASPFNLGAIALVAALGVGLGRARWRGWGRRTALGWGLGLALCGGLGFLARARSDTLGLHRQAAWALVESGLRQAGVGLGTPPSPSAPLAASDGEGEGEAVDLTHFRGSARGRSVIWVILESTGARHLGAYGARPDPMPELSRLAERSLVFEHVGAAHPESIKTLFSMLCATWPASHLEAAALIEAKVPCRSVAATLGRSGYRTGLFHSGRFAYLGMREVLAGRGFDVLEDADAIRGAHYSSFGTDDRATAEHVLRFIDETPPGRPFFAVYMPIAGHHPYLSPGEGPRPFAAHTEQEDYRNDLYAGDDALGKLWRGVAERGLADHVVWLVNGDHGEAFHEHAGNFAHSLFVYEENLHVPVVLVIPGATPRAIRVPQVGSLIDLAPTLLETLDLSPPARWQGRSLLEPEAGVAFAYVDHAQWLVAVRDGPWKLIVDLETDRAQLFDLGADPGELLDRAAGHPERAARYREAARAWAMAQRGLLTAYPWGAQDAE